MSLSIEIYAQTRGVGLASFARDVVSLSGVERQHASEDPYVFRVPAALCSIIPKIQDDYETDAFDVEILMDRRGEDEEAFIQYSRGLFEKLKALDKYPLLMVWDSQRDMARFEGSASWWKRSSRTAGFRSC